MYHFNSRPHKEVDEESFNKWFNEIISIHDLTRRSTVVLAMLLKLCEFQFTTSQGGRHCKSYFRVDNRVFQFTTSQGGRLLLSLSFNPSCHFNSRPHKEVDDPVRHVQEQECNISIHDLTRRSTTAIIPNSNPQIFQFTTSQGGRRTQPVPPVVYLSFQFTTSQGGRLASANAPIPCVVFQFTTSQGGRLTRHRIIAVLMSFQFTTSQGGRPPRVVISGIQYNFNSRPHKEVDRTCRGQSNPIWYFNSRPHKEVDHSVSHPSSDHPISIHDLTRRSTATSFCFRPSMKYFNSRPHKEVDLPCGRRCTEGSYFNSRPHKEVDSCMDEVLQAFCISIHDLTRRSTDLALSDMVQIDISIHDLTRRSTLPAAKVAEVRAFQFTTSQGGRRSGGRSNNKLVSISIHDHTRRSTRGAFKEG